MRGIGYLIRLDILIYSLHPLDRRNLEWNADWQARLVLWELQFQQPHALMQYPVAQKFKPLISSLF
jgi:hypothetical protein